MYSVVSSFDTYNNLRDCPATPSMAADSTELLCLSPSGAQSVHPSPQHHDVTSCTSPVSGSDQPSRPMTSPSINSKNNLTVAATQQQQQQQPQQQRHSSRWNKLRTTVKVASAATSAVSRRNGAVSTAGRQHNILGYHHRRGSLTREDSFLKKYSTRYGVAPYTASAAADRAAEAVDRLNDSNGQGGAGDRSGKDGDVDGEAARGLEDVERRRRRRQRRFVVNPDENFAFYWLAVTSLAVLYNLWACIARQAFPEVQHACDICWWTFDALCDLIYVGDIVVQLRTGYLERGLLVYDSRKLAVHYLCSWCFVLDLVSLTPLDFLQLFIGTQPIIRAPRFLKSYRLVRFVHVFEMRTGYPNMWRVANLSHLLFLGSHWFAAFYYLISSAGNFQSRWGYPDPVGNFSSVAKKYLRSLYWSTLTLTTIGDLEPPETNWEHVFTIVSYLIGVFVFATIVGQVGNVITNRNASRLEFERLLKTSAAFFGNLTLQLIIQDGAKSYMRYNQVPQDMQRHVQRWYDYAWSRGRMTGGSDINALGLLPDKLKTELALHVNLGTLKKVTLFHDCEPEFLHDLVLKMKTFIFTPGDLICRKGEVAREMFIIVDGLLEVISDTGEILNRLSSGDFFGEIGILNLAGGFNRRTADVRSVGYSELIVLSRDDVLSALKDHPAAENLIKEYAQKRLKELETRRAAGDPGPALTSAIQVKPNAVHFVQPNITKVSDTSPCTVSRELDTIESAGDMEAASTHSAVDVVDETDPSSSAAAAAAARARGLLRKLIGDDTRSNSMSSGGYRKQQGDVRKGGIPSITMTSSTPVDRRSLESSGSRRTSCVVSTASHPLPSSAGRRRSSTASDTVTGQQTDEETENDSQFMTECLVHHTETCDTLLLMTDNTGGLPSLGSVDIDDDDFQTNDCFASLVPDCDVNGRFQDDVITSYKKGRRWSTGLAAAISALSVSDAAINGINPEMEVDFDGGQWTPYDNRGFAYPVADRSDVMMEPRDDVWGSERHVDTIAAETNSFVPFERTWLGNHKQSNSKCIQIFVRSMAEHKSDEFCSSSISANDYTTTARRCSKNRLSDLTITSSDLAARGGDGNNTELRPGDDSHPLQPLTTELRPLLRRSSSGSRSAPHFTSGSAKGPPIARAPSNYREGNLWPVAVDSRRSSCPERRSYRQYTPDVRIVFDTEAAVRLEKSSLSLPDRQRICADGGVTSPATGQSPSGNRCHVQHSNITTTSPTLDCREQAEFDSLLLNIIKRYVDKLLVTSQSQYSSRIQTLTNEIYAKDAEIRRLSAELKNLQANQPQSDCGSDQ